MLPGAARRLARRRSALVTVFLIGSLAAGAASVGEALLVRIDGSVDAHWRGGYDILVRPPSTQLDIEQTNGVIEPNFLSFAGQGGISQAQLAAIRSIRDVDLAAPIGFMGYLSIETSSATVHLPEPPAEPTLYRLTLTTATHDGVSERLIQRQVAHLLFGPDLSVSDLGDVAGSTLASRVFPPAILSPLMAVDPEAERLLLGETASWFGPLTALGDGERTAQSFDLDAVPQAFGSARSQIAFAAASESSAQRSRPVVPLVVSSRIYAPLTLRLEVQQVGAPLPDEPIGEGIQQLQEALAQAGDELTEVGVSVADVGAKIRPLYQADISIAWPDAPIGETSITSFESGEFVTRLLGRPEYDPLSVGADGTLAFGIRPLDLVTPDGTRVTSPLPSPTTGLFGAVELGIERAYRDVRIAQLPLTEEYVHTPYGDRPFYLAPVGQFDLGQLSLPNDPLSYVPFGAYDPPATDLVAGPDEVALSEPVALSPTLQPAGLLMVPPLAVTDLSAAEVLRGRTPIDAVRVRVAGVTDFSSEARLRIERVASAIASMSLDVDIVAGSSPQQVEIIVPDYDVATSPSTDLGRIRQGWTTLGAAERVEQGLSGGTRLLLVLALLVAGTIAAGGEMLVAASRRRDAALLVSAGWTRLQIVRWFAAEALIGGLLVTLLTAGVWLITEHSTIALAAGLTMAMLLVAAMATGIWWATRGASGGGYMAVSAGDLWTGAQNVPILRVRGPVSLGLRSVMARPGRTLLIATGLGLAAAALSVGLLVIASTAERVGPTLLAEALAITVGPQQLLLVASVGLGGVALSILLRRMDAAARLGEARALHAAGWRVADLRRTETSMSLFLALPASLLAAPIGMVTGGSFEGIDPTVAALVAVLVATSVALVGGLGTGWAQHRRVG